MNIVRRAKAEWIQGIEIFDRDLYERMREIIYHERQGDLAKAELSYYYMTLGFATKGAFPWWRNRQSEWQYRNQERWDEYTDRYRKTEAYKLVNHNYYLRRKIKEPDFMKNYREDHKKQIKEYRISHKEEHREYDRLRYLRIKKEKELKNETYNPQSEIRMEDCNANMG